MQLNEIRWYLKRLSCWIPYFIDVLNWGNICTPSGAVSVRSLHENVQAGIFSCNVKYVIYHIWGKITECWLAQTAGIFIKRAWLLYADWLSAPAWSWWSNCFIPRHSVPPLFSLVGVLWRTQANTIDAILIPWHVFPASKAHLKN